MCRFINTDSSLHEKNIEGLNLYAYCGKNPVRYSDPTGEWFGIDDAVVGTTIIIFGGLTLLSILGVAWATDIQEKFAGAFFNDFSNLLNLFSKQSKKSGKEKGNDIPSWVNKGLVVSDLSAQENASRMLDDKYGKGGWHKGPNSEYNKIVKWISRSLNVIYVPDSIDYSGKFFYDDFGNYMYSVNETKKVYAVQDGPTHVSVRPVGALMEYWINAGSGSIWTQAVKSVIIKWDGGY